MKNIRLLVLLVGILLYSNVFAAWNPDTDPNLTFNLNFESNTDGPPATTTDAVSSLVGTAYDYNTTNYVLWLTDVNSIIRGICADVNASHDANSRGSGDGNDCSIRAALPNTESEIFELGTQYVRHTYTFWFRTSTLNEGTIIRHENFYADEDPATYGNSWWEIRIYQGKLHFYHRLSYLRMETTSTLAALGLTANTWHNAALVIDRTTETSSKIFVDGLEVPVTVTAYNAADSANVDPSREAPLRVGAGERAFDGQLDEVRIYNKALSSVEASILYQTNPDDENTPVAILPILRSEDNIITVDANWIPATNASLTAQKVYLGIDSNEANMTLVKSGDDTLDIVTNAELGGPLNFNTKYYWRIVSTIGGNDVNGPMWTFTTGASNAYDPSPANGAEDVPDNNINLQWLAPSATSFDVYMSIHSDRVEANDPNYRIADDINDPNFVVADTNKGETYYWRVNSNYSSIVAPGTIWHFRAEARPIVVNTSDVNVVYEDVDYPALSLTKDANLAGTVTGYLGDDDVAIFDFASDPNFSKLYDMIFIPAIDSNLEAQYYAAGHRRTPRPVALHVTGGLDLKCHIIASGLDALARQGDPGLNNPGSSSYGRAGGHRGSYRNENRDAFSTADKLEIFGTGYGATSSSYNCGAGGGYGGAGGDQGRAGAGSGGDSYGNEDITYLLGGSAGGWSNNAQGGPGGGAIEIAATGDINVASTAKILVKGGSCPAVSYGAGGGAGGSVKIVTSGAFKCRGVIDANGGKGGDTLQTGEPRNTGGGGGGGRIAIFYGTTYDVDANTIKASGGARGARPDGTPEGTYNGASGTRHHSIASPLIPNLQSPADGSDAVLNDANKITLEWYPGFSPTQNKIYFGTSSNPNDLTLVATIDGNSAKGGILRVGQSFDANVTPGQTYYWYVHATNGVQDVNSDIWSFYAVNNYTLVFNTSDVNDVNYPAPDGERIEHLTCRIKDATGWVVTPVATGTVGDDGVTIFDFNGFNYDRNYTVVVLPEYEPSFDNQTRRPLAIHVTGDFYFNGKMDISGDDAVDGSSSSYFAKARSGGGRGLRKGSGTSPSPSSPDAGTGGTYFTLYTRGPWTITRFGTESANRTYFAPTASGYSVFGLGLPPICPDPVGGGAGYGGIGGNSARGYWYGAFVGGIPYGDKEIPIPFGGSSGGHSRSIGSGAGGGGVEIVATGSVTFGENAYIYAEGGSVTQDNPYGGGAGSGGSIKIIAAANFTNDGIIDANGGAGGNGTEKYSCVGGGGAGGRIAVYFGSTYTNNGVISADGGAAGIYHPASGKSSLLRNTPGFASPGQDGTIYVSLYDANDAPRKASAPTPRNGNDMIYCPTDPCTIQLKWYSGYYNGTSATDTVYFGTNPTPATSIASRTVTARGQQQQVDVNVEPNTVYYWQVGTVGDSNNTAQSDVWSFETVRWQWAEPNSTITPAPISPAVDTLPWDTGPYYNCQIDFDDFVVLGEFWRKADTNVTALRRFAEKWLWQNYRQYP